MIESWCLASWCCVLSCHRLGFFKWSDVSVTLQVPRWLLWAKLVQKDVISWDWWTVGGQGLPKEWGLRRLLEGCILVSRVVDFFSLFFFSSVWIHLIKEILTPWSFKICSIIIGFTCFCWLQNNQTGAHTMTPVSHLVKLASRMGTGPCPTCSTSSPVPCCSVLGTH